MTRIEMELHSIRTSIEAYKNILRDNDLSDEKVADINRKIGLLCEYRDGLLRENNNYDL